MLGTMSAMYVCTCGDYITLPQLFVNAAVEMTSAPLNGGLSVGPPAQDRAASRRPITINLGNWSLPQVGDGCVTPSLPRVVAQVNYPTPPSGEWAVYENAASSDRAFQVVPVSVETFTTLETVLDVCWHL